MSEDPTTKSAGVYRDGKLLMIQREGAEFSPRCIKSGQCDDISYHEISSEPGKTLHQGFVVTLGMLNGPGGMASAAFAVNAQNKREQKLHLPLSRRWYESWKSVTPKGWALVAGGMLSFLISCLLNAFAPINSPDWVTFLLMLPLMFSPLLAIAGLVYMALSQRPIFTVKKVTPEYLWVSGVTPEVLAEYPEKEEA